ncbi:MAG: hypothetical protein HW421_1170 [Ignavibacteria bacterium]|nr:hypothetical protein [Ignavibacteria bacterium]
MIKLLTHIPENLGLSSKYLRKSDIEYDRIFETVIQSLKNTERISFLYLWGVSFKKDSIDIYEQKSMSYLNFLVSKIGLTFSSPINLHIIYTDLHGIANQINIEHIEKYYQDIYKLAKLFNFSLSRLSSYFSEKEIENLYITENENSELFEKKKEILIKYASNSGIKDTAETRAYKYFITRIKEKPILSSQFKDTILLAGERLNLDFLLLDLPRLYIYDSDFKKNHKPWNLIENKEEALCVEL